MRPLAHLFFLLATAAHAQTWTQLPDFPGTARDDAASFTLGNKIYVGTGMEVGWGLTNDWWCFDAATDTWSAMASMPTSPRQYCSAFTVNDTGYVFGGVDGSGALNELWAYYPETDQWVQKSPLPAEARYACVSVEGWNYGIVATGMLPSGVPTKEAWKYLPAMDSWQAMNPVPGPSRHRAVAFLDGAGMLITGGADSTGAALSDAWSYPVWFETGQYYPRAPLPAGRIDAKSGGPYVMVVAGGASDATMFHADVWDGTSLAWQALPPFPSGPRRGAVGSGVAHTWSNSFYFGLGLDGGQVRHNDWWRLDFATGITEEHAPRIILSPNPATGTVHVRWPEPWSEARIRLIDAWGRLVEERQVDKGGAMDVAPLRPGHYVVEVQHGPRRLRGILTKLP
ncbi:MAG: T9SS type A sorting domain-containing protein [Flavobacteriales bacterium]|nr:T9SS type A sorting domain-containing protein [Flavobacteriales bacterium]MBP9080934.1 T9SS type A sorting domain-containing protein [Flavobacteriales bacterium]